MDSSEIFDYHDSSVFWKYEGSVMAYSNIKELNMLFYELVLPSLYRKIWTYEIIDEEDVDNYAITNGVVFHESTYNLVVIKVRSNLNQTNVLIPTSLILDEHLKSEVYDRVVELYSEASSMDIDKHYPIIRPFLTSLNNKIRSSWYCTGIRSVLNIPYFYDDGFDEFQDVRSLSFEGYVNGMNYQAIMGGK